MADRVARAADLVRRRFDVIIRRVLATFRVPRVSPAEGLCIAGGLFLVLASSWIMDDAFVYFRYADNLLFLGLGLVYNAGEYVEGFSSPLWMFLLIALRALHLPYVIIVRAVGVGSFLAWAYLLVRLNRKLAPEPSNANLALAYLSVNYGVACYFTSGLESPLVLVAAPLFALYVLAPSSRALQIGVGLFPLVRPEFALPLLPAAAWGWWRSRRMPRWLLLTAGATVAGYLLFRVYYYADLFPNTFYLKNETMPRQGLLYVHETLSTYLAYVWFPAMLLLAILLVRRRVEIAIAPRLVMLAAAALVAAYVVKIGGDARHFRYLAFPFTLAACASAGLAEQALCHLAPNRARWLAPLLTLATMLLIHLRYPPQLDSHPLYFDPEVTIVNGISDAQSHRRAPSLQPADWRSKATIAAMKRYRREHDPFAYADILAFDWCVSNYKHFDSRRINSLGLTDAILARVEMASDRPAHKLGLRPLAKDLERIQRAAPVIGRGMYRRAVESGQAPDWIARNLAAIETVERKIYGPRHIRESLALAFSPRISIQP